MSSWLLDNHVDQSLSTYVSDICHRTLLWCPHDYQIIQWHMSLAYVDRDCGVTVISECEWFPNPGSQLWLATHCDSASYNNNTRNGFLVLHQWQSARWCDKVCVAKRVATATDCWVLPTWHEPNKTVSGWLHVYCLRIKETAQRPTRCHW